MCLLKDAHSPLDILATEDYIQGFLWFLVQILHCAWKQSCNYVLEWQISDVLRHLNSCQTLCPILISRN